MERRGPRGQEVEIAKILARHAQARRPNCWESLSEWRWSRTGWSMKPTARALEDPAPEAQASDPAEDDDNQA